MHVVLFCLTLIIERIAKVKFEESAMLIVKQVCQMTDTEKRMDYHFRYSQATKAEQDMIAEMDGLLIKQ